MTESAPENGGSRHKRYLRNFLIDKRFQLGWVFRVALVASIIVAVMGYFLYTTLVESIELTSAQALTTQVMTQEAQRAIIEQGAKEKLFTGVVLGGSLMGLVLILSMLTIVVTHKTAGPVYKIKRLLSTIDGEHLQLYENLRKGDDLHDVFEAFANMLRRLREARHLEVERLENAVAELETLGGSGEALDAINDVIKEYRKSIRME